MVVNVKRQLLISFSIIIASFLVAAAIVYFLVGNISAQAAKITSDQSEITASLELLNSFTAIRAQVPQANAYRSAIEKLLPTQDGLIGFGQWLSVIASKYNVSANATFQGSNTLPVSHTPGQSMVIITISGPVNGIISFLKAIEEQSPGFLVSISSFDLLTSSPDYRLVAQGTLYFL
jgi:hypothetical protein